MLSLAEESSMIDCFTHVSTAYVNSDRQGHIDEKVYDLPKGQDSEQIVAKIMSMSREEAFASEKQIIGKFPNTYTYTKSLTEKTLKKRNSRVKVAIVRPSIVISALNEPMLGWTETISAMGGLLFAGMLGLIHYLYVDQKQILDIVPVDYVSNAIIATAAYCSKFGVSGDDPMIVHSSSSRLNPISIGRIVEVLLF